VKLAATAAGFLAFASGLLAQGVGGRSLTDFESRDPQGSSLSPALAADEGADAREQLLLARASIKALTESLAIANSEAETFKRRSADLAMKIEALGLPKEEGDSSKLEGRLLSAVRDLRLLKKQQDDTSTQLVRLTEAVIAMLKTTDSVDPQVRLRVETELRKTGEIMGAGSPGANNAKAIEATLGDGMVVDIKYDLSLAVLNIGAKQGVKVGMPFQIIRDNKLIGTVRAVDVRDRITGAVIQDLESENDKIRTGDRAKVDARQ